MNIQLLRKISLIEGSELVSGELHRSTRYNQEFNIELADYWLVAPYNQPPYLPTPEQNLFPDLGTELCLETGFTRAQLPVQEELEFWTETLQIWKHQEQKKKKKHEKLHSQRKL